MGCLWDLLTIVAIAVWIVPLVVQGVVDTRTAALALFVLVAAAGAVRGMGSFIRALLPLFSLLTFAIVYGGGDMSELARVLITLSPLLVALFGVWVMFRGFRR